MTKVMISYSSMDRPAASAMASSLTAFGMNVWWDIALKPGNAYAREIDAIIRDVDHVVVLWSSPAALGKRRKPGAAAFLADLEKECLTLERTLTDGSYRPGRYVKIELFDPKHRIVCKLRGYLVNEIVYQRPVRAPSAEQTLTTAHLLARMVFNLFCVSLPKPPGGSGSRGAMRASRPSARG